MFQNFKVSLNKTLLEKKNIKKKKIQKKKIQKKSKKKSFSNFKIILDKFILSSFLKRKWIKSNPKKAKDLFIFSFDQKKDIKKDNKDIKIDEKNLKRHNYLKTKRKTNFPKKDIISKVKNLVNSLNTSSSISNLVKLTSNDKTTSQKADFSGITKKKDFIYYEDQDNSFIPKKDISIPSKKETIVIGMQKNENNHSLSQEDLQKIKDIFLTIDELLLDLPKNLLEKLVESTFYGNYLEIFKKIKDL